MEEGIKSQGLQDHVNVNQNKILEKGTGLCKGRKIVIKIVLVQCFTVFKFYFYM